MKQTTNLKAVWKDAPSEFKFFFLFGVFGFILILTIGFIGEYQDWDGERANRVRATKAVCTCGK